jgi:hypothetical protein
MAFNYSPKISREGLVLYLDAANPKSYSGTGTAWTDLSGNGNNGVLQNTPTFDSLNGGSIYLNGTNQRILINCGSNLIRSYNTTCFFTIKLPIYTGGQRCILSYRGGNGGQLYIGKQSGGIFSYYDSVTPQNYTVGTINNDTIAICCVVVNADNGSISHYINGNLAGTATGRTGFSTALNTIMYLGFDAGGTNEYMLGNFYSFMHYNRVLSASEVLQNYNALKSRFNLS